MKRLGILVVPVLLCLLVVAMRPAEGQDNLDDRMSALETEVADLQTAVAVLQSSPVTSLPKPSSLEAHTLTGSVILSGHYMGLAQVVEVLSDETKECIGAGAAAIGGFDDIVPGVPVTIRDGQGATIGMSRLGTGTYSNWDGTTLDCTFAFSVSDLPASDFYSIEIGDRDPIPMSNSELESNGWSVAIPLGR